jgi:DNA-directed RNA polymerase subunit RPC12/RpoP
MNPSCPYCGERQAYQEARPTKPRIIKYWDYTPQRGTYEKRETVWDTECRNCSQRIVWCIYLYPKQPPSWNKPHVEALI